jgi:hypothetical protein
LSVLVKYGASARASSGVKVSTVVGYSTSHAGRVGVSTSALGAVP